MSKRDQTELGNQYAIKALKGQRATLAGEILLLKRKLAWAQKQIRHVDATLHLLDPLANPSVIPPKRPQVRIKLFRQGELGRHVIDALRRAGKPLSLSELTSAVIAQGGLGEEARRTVGPRIRGNLAYLDRNDKVTKIGIGRSTTWELAQPK